MTSDKVLLEPLLIVVNACCEDSSVRRDNKCFDSSLLFGVSLTTPLRSDKSSMNPYSAIFSVLSNPIFWYERRLRNSDQHMRNRKPNEKVKAAKTTGKDNCSSLREKEM